MNRTYIIILDGAADRPTLALDHGTPLEIALTPNLDKLAARGQSSMIAILPPDYIPETDSGVMALLGYDPLIYYKGRGMLEAYGLGFAERARYVAGFRINIASAGNGTLDRRTARGLSDEELRGIQNVLKERIKIDVDFEILLFGGYRGIVCFFSNEIALSGNISNSDPGFEKIGYFSFPATSFEQKRQRCRPLDDSVAARYTAELVNSFSDQAEVILKHLDLNRIRQEADLMEANCILFRDGGSKVERFPDFFSLHKKSLRIYGQLPCERGIARLCGAAFSYTQALKLQHDEEYLERLAKEIVKIQEDMVAVHLKGPDEPGHDGDAFGKVRAIENIDRAFFTSLLSETDKTDTVVVTCDHATPYELKQHSGDKVPLVIAGQSFWQDDQQLFGERYAAQGGCKVKRAIDLIDCICGGNSNATA